jgi:hypothetical protein
MNSDTSPALLTKTELDWLQHKIKVSKVYEYRLKSDIKKKLQTFQQLELPLLMKNGFVSSAANDLSVYPQSLSANPQISESSNKARIELLKPKEVSLGRDLDQGPLPYLLASAFIPCAFIRCSVPSFQRSSSVSPLAT